MMVGRRLERDITYEALIASAAAARTSSSSDRIICGSGHEEPQVRAAP